MTRFEAIRDELRALYLRAFAALHKGPIHEIEVRIARLEAEMATVLHLEGARA